MALNSLYASALPFLLLPLPPSDGAHEVQSAGVAPTERELPPPPPPLLLLL